MALAAWEAEAGESLEPGRCRLQLAKITPVHSSLRNSERLSLKENKKEKSFNTWLWDNSISTGKRMKLDIGHLPHKIYKNNLNEL